MKTTILAKVDAYLVHRRALGFQLKCEGQQLQNFARYADGLAYLKQLTGFIGLGVWRSSGPLLSTS
jgi:hypothetical protein